MLHVPPAHKAALLRLELWIWSRFLRSVTHHPTYPGTRDYTTFELHAESGILIRTMNNTTVRVFQSPDWGRERRW